MTDLLFLTDAYIQTFEAVVTAQVDGGVVLDQTAFYPGGGGQPFDTGLLTSGEQSWPISKAKKVAGQVVHFIAGDLPAVGTAVTGQLDWERRYRLMRTHTAMHILCGVIWRDYGASVTGGNMDPLKGRMDFEFETMRQELVAEIETAVNKEVEAARNVRVRILPRAEAFQIPDLIRTKINLLPEGIKEVRTVELVGLDLQADGGTHVNNTREVGPMHIVNYKSKGKINKRIYVELED
ncbi:MAG: alanyl-tRNA editing protein [Anaerolineales bacterium]|nr:alanyl-tRNA editing protein [Anaerolineales bacterium]MCA9928797.1 alanyl-tRNA editing protein [Anaerolineales bacterium]